MSDVEARCGGNVNAGFFNTTTVEPLGTTVYYRSGAKVVQRDDRGLGPENVGVGVKGGEAVMGWVPGVDEGYDWYVSGLGWLLRSGENYLDKSWPFGDDGVQSTGPAFRTVKSARTAACVKDGMVSVVQVEGKTWVAGVNLYEFVELLAGLGFADCVNLDGGGSVGAVFEGVEAITSGNECEGGRACMKEVAVELCFGLERGVKYVAGGDGTTAPTPSPQAVSTQAPTTEFNSGISGRPACETKSSNAAWLVAFALGLCLAYSLWFHHGPSPSRHLPRRNAGYGDVELAKTPMRAMSGGGGFDGDYAFNGGSGGGVFSYDDDDDDDEEINPFSPNLRS